MSEMSDFMKFTEFNLSNAMMRAVEELGFSEATPIQEQCIPAIMNQKDLIGQSQTGTGKTAAFAIPIIEQISMTDHKRPQVLILSPTRELAMQITDHIRLLTKFKEGLRTVTVYGGQPILVQIKELKFGADIVVGTPGRILDHIRRKTLRFEHLKHLVIDEADEMLQMGFKEELEDILKVLPENRQTSLFSATMPKSILDITNQYLVDPLHIAIAPKQKTIAAIQQMVYEVNHPFKTELLIQLLHLYQPSQAMIFCNTKKMVDELADIIAQQGFNSAAIHGDMKQEMRTVVMGKFKRQQIRFLIATDVAARGIDIDQLEMVINFDLPQDDEYYIHRIGRTGRAGSQGMAITLVQPREKRHWDLLVRYQNLSVTYMTIPTQSDLDGIQEKQIKTMINKQISAEIPNHVSSLTQTLLEEGMDPARLIEILLKQVMGDRQLAAIPQLKNKPSRTYRTYILNIGSKQGISPTKIIKQSSVLCGIESKHIGDIRIKGNQTYLDISSHIEPNTVAKLSKMSPKQKVSVQLSDDKSKNM